MSSAFSNGIRAWHRLCCGWSALGTCLRHEQLAHEPNLQSYLHGHFFFAAWMNCFIWWIRRRCLKWQYLPNVSHSIKRSGSKYKFVLLTDRPPLAEEHTSTSTFTYARAWAMQKKRAHGEGDDDDIWTHWQESKGGRCHRRCIPASLMICDLSNELLEYIFGFVVSDSYSLVRECIAEQEGKFDEITFGIIRVIRNSETSSRTEWESY